MNDLVERAPIKLKPCPFCGGAAEILRLGTRRQSCQIGCTFCSCWLETGEYGERCGERWNQRAAIAVMREPSDAGGSTDAGTRT